MVLQGSYSFDPEAPETVLYWDVMEQDSTTWIEGNAQEETGKIRDDFCRASKQYDSILLNSSQGCGWKVLSYRSAGGEEFTVIKVYKPNGIKQIRLHGEYTDHETYEKKETIVTMDFTRKDFLAYSCMVVTLTFGNEDELPEISEHTSDATASISQFKEKSHELQINGSNFCVSLQDYLDPNRYTINGYEVRAIPNYCNIAMTRTFQKFFIGGYNNDN